jgi:hypothetical protein
MKFLFILRRVLWAAPVMLAVSAPAFANPDSGQRVVILRERTSLELLDGSFSLELLKIRGYMINIRVNGNKRKLKRGDSVSPQGAKCTVTFQKISPETRIARFLTDCS